MQKTHHIRRSNSNNCSCMVTAVKDFVGVVKITPPGCDRCLVPDHKTGSTSSQILWFILFYSTYLPAEQPLICLSTSFHLLLQGLIFFSFFFFSSSRPIMRTWQTPEGKASPISVWLKVQARFNYQTGEQSKRADNSTSEWPSRK